MKTQLDRLDCLQDFKIAHSFTKLLFQKLLLLDRSLCLQIQVGALMEYLSHVHLLLLISFGRLRFERLDHLTESDDGFVARHTFQPIFELSYDQHSLQVLFAGHLGW